MLVLVVGPSGAGKDTLLGLAQRQLAWDPRFRFVRRTITRLAAAGGEDHESIHETEFDRRQSAGGFALSWRAHGLCYGVPADIDETIAQGRVAIVNASRTEIESAAQRFPTRVIEVIAAPEILAQRLTGRGRENPGDISARLARAVALPANVPVETVRNETNLEAAIESFLTALNRAAEFSRKL